MGEMAGFRSAVLQWSAGNAEEAAAAADLAAGLPVTTGVLVEGASDQVAVETLCARRGLERVGLGTELTRAGMEELGFFICDDDLEAELIRTLGVAAVERVVEQQGDGKSLRILQRQPAQRSWTAEQQLRRFMGSIGGRKARYGRALIEALGDSPAPRPLELLVAHLRQQRLDAENHAS